MIAFEFVAVLAVGVIGTLVLFGLGTFFGGINNLVNRLFKGEKSE